MLITEVDFTLPPASSGLDFRKPARRSRGLHVSEIIRSLDNRVLNPGQRRPDLELSDEEMRRMGNYREGGFILELAVDALLSGDLKEGGSLLLRKLVSHFFKHRMIARRKVALQGEIVIEVELPGKRKRTALYGTPDGLDVPNLVLEEYKCTWRSSNRLANIEIDFVTWFWQIKEYLFMLSLIHGQHILCARLFVFFINGDYRKSGPQIRQFNLSFSWHELQENHDMLMRRAAKMVA